MKPHRRPVQFSPKRKREKNAQGKRWKLKVIISKNL